MNMKKFAKNFLWTALLSSALSLFAYEGSYEDLNNFDASDDPKFPFDREVLIEAFYDVPTAEKLSEAEALLKGEFEKGNKNLMPYFSHLYLKKATEAYVKDFYPVAKKAALQGDVSGLASIYAAYYSLGDGRYREILKDMYVSLNKSQGVDVSDEEVEKALDRSGYCGNTQASAYPFETKEQELIAKIWYFVAQAYDTKALFCTDNYEGAREAIEFYEMASPYGDSLDRLDRLYSSYDEQRALLTLREDRFEIAEEKSQEWVKRGIELFSSLHALEYEKLANEVLTKVAPYDTDADLRQILLYYEAFYALEGAESENAKQWLKRAVEFVEANTENRIRRHVELADFLRSTNMPLAVEYYVKAFNLTDDIRELRGVGFNFFSLPKEGWTKSVLKCAQAALEKTETLKNTDDFYVKSLREQALSFLDAVYWNGSEEIPADRKMSTKYCEIRANEGDITSMANMYVKYEEGLVLEKDPQKAAFWMERLKEACKGKPGRFEGEIAHRYGCIINNPQKRAYWEKLEEKAKAEASQ